jgi:hypothetical protein
MHGNVLHNRAIQILSRLTCTRPCASRRASRHRDAPSGAGKGETMTTARILIVEDEHLIALGYTVVGLAASGEEAIAQAAGL